MEKKRLSYIGWLSAILLIHLRVNFNVRTINIREMKILGKLTWVIVFLLLFTVKDAFTQISGKIVDEANSPLEYATVAIYQQKDSLLVTGNVTEPNGSFIIPFVEAGAYYVVASFIGYKSRTIGDIVMAKKGEKKNLGQIMLSMGIELDEVTVQGERATVLNKIDRQVFDSQKFQSAQGGTATDVLRNLPSVQVDGQGEISVRGSKGFVVLLNGKPFQGNAASLIDQLPANAIDRVEVITAPSASYDPEGKAGIINILTKKGAADGSFVQVNLRGGLPSIENYDNANIHQRYGMDAIYNVRKDKWNISMGGSYQRNDLGGRREGDVYTIINDTLTRFPSDGERSFDVEDFSGRFTVDFTPDSTNNFSLGFYGGIKNKDRLADIVYYDNHASVVGEDNNRLYTIQYFNHNLRTRTSDFALGSLDYSHIFGNSSKLSTSFLYEYTLLGGPTVNQNLGYPNANILYQDEYNTNDNPLNGIRFQLDYTWQPFSFGKLQTGYQYRKLLHVGDFVYQRRNDFNSEFQLVPDFSSEVDLERTIHAGYGQLTGKKGRWDYSLGARMEVMDRALDLKDKAGTIDTTYVYNFVKLYPSASVQYGVDNDWALKAAYSKRVDRTTTFKMNPFPEREHSETLEQGDPELLPEFIDLFELGFNKYFQNDQSVYATAYFRNVENLVNRVNTVYNDSILNRIYTNVGTAKVVGLEVGAEFKPHKRWTNFVGGNIYRYAIDGTFDNREVNTTATVYSFNVNSTLQFWKTASVQFTLNYLSDRNTAQGEDSRYYSPNLTLRKTFMDRKLAVTLQWLNMDMGLLDTNEQRISTWRDGEFYTTTNYVYEVDMFVLNLSYTFRNGKNRSKFIKSEFGEREF
ncbi:TonB-dependent receptor [Limibacter armeniacum]|uniref:TonB-dependent receptor domain-containing protein n=1 Tax=Limibacter armeniacum TaxID=466084 RepID=UPI002FE5FFEA